MKASFLYVRNAKERMYLKKKPSFHRLVACSRDIGLGSTTVQEKPAKLTNSKLISPLPPATSRTPLLPHNIRNDINQIYLLKSSQPYVSMSHLLKVPHLNEFLWMSQWRVQITYFTLFLLPTPRVCLAISWFCFPWIKSANYTFVFIDIPALSSICTTALGLWVKYSAG